LRGDDVNNKPAIVVVDNFLDDPGAIRNTALRQIFFPSDGYKGKRTREQFLQDVYKTAFEDLLRIKIGAWAEHEMNGTFQLCTPEDPIVYHCDGQTHAGIIFLTPDAPPESGTTLYRSKKSHARRFNDDPSMFNGGFYDPTLWDEVDVIGNVYNRLVLWQGDLVHSASCYFGKTVDDARMFQMFFFDEEK
jgi:hypothetical protein